MTHSPFYNSRHHLLCILLLCCKLIGYTSLQTTNDGCEGGTCDIKDKNGGAESEQHGKAKYTGNLTFNYRR